MTLAGTRPPTVDEWDKYELHHRARLATKPGLTGMWQVSGRSNITDFEEVVKLDKQYISEERYKERQKQSRPAADALFAWLHSMEDDVDRSSLIGDAVLYTLNQERYLRRYLEDGHLSIDNNSAERAIKNFAAGRRNWLFAKSIRGANASIKNWWFG